MMRVLFLLLVAVLLPLSAIAQVNLLPNNKRSGVNVGFGLQGDAFNLKKGIFAHKYESENEIEVVTHSLSMGFKFEIEKEVKKTPLTISFHYARSHAVASLFGGNEVGLVKNPVEMVFLFMNGPIERNVTSMQNYALDFKTTLISTSIFKRENPGIYLRMISGVGRAEYEGEEITYYDHPNEETGAWKEQHTTLNFGGELAIFPTRKNETLSFVVSAPKKYLPKQKKFEDPIVSFNFGFRLSF